MFYAFVQRETVTRCKSNRMFSPLRFTEQPKLSDYKYSVEISPGRILAEVLPPLTDAVGLVGNRLVHHLQVLINHGGIKDGSGGPLDYEDLESAEVLYFRDAGESGRTSPQPAEHQSVIVVR